MNEGEYIVPKYCELCGSDNVAVRALFDRGITRYVCLDCGNSRSIAKESNLNKRVNTSLNNWAGRITKFHPFCYICGSKVNLEAHHIIPVSHSKQYAYSYTNGITLCKTHHYLVHHKEEHPDEFTV